VDLCWFWLCRCWCDFTMPQSHPSWLAKKTKKMWNKLSHFLFVSAMTALWEAGRPWVRPWDIFLPLPWDFSDFCPRDLGENGRTLQSGARVQNIFQGHIERRYWSGSHMWTQWNLGEIWDLKIVYIKHFPGTVLKLFPKKSWGDFDQLLQSGTGVRFWSKWNIFVYSLIASECCSQAFLQAEAQYISKFWLFDS
jgi:hypothetical protein